MSNNNRILKIRKKIKKKRKKRKEKRKIQTGGQFAFLFGFGFDDVIGFPALSVALFSSVLSEIEIAIAFGLVASPAQNDIRTKSQELILDYEIKE